MRKSTALIITLSLLFITIGQSNAKNVLEVKIKNRWIDAASVGIVNLTGIDSTIKLDLKYSTKDNFLKEVLYENVTSCFLQECAAIKLSKAQKYLDSIKPGYSLIVYDALRPRSAQFKMWDIVKGTPHQMYVGNPHSGSIHNYGAAVDVSIVGTPGKEIDMGTPFDFFDDLAQPRYEDKFLKEGRLTTTQITNRELLRTVMTVAGYQGISVEWWHFNAFSKKYIQDTFPVIDDVRYSIVD